MMATLFKVLTAANRRVGRGELKNNCSTIDKKRFKYSIGKQFTYSFVQCIILLTLEHNNNVYFEGIAEIKQITAQTKEIISEK